MEPPNTFVLGDRHGRITDGINVWSQPFLLQSNSDEEVAVLLIDTEGTGISPVHYPTVGGNSIFQGQYEEGYTYLHPQLHSQPLPHTSNDGQLERSDLEPQRGFKIQAPQPPSHQIYLTADEGETDGENPYIPLHKTPPISSTLKLQENELK